MKSRLLILLFFSMSTIPLIYAEESNIFEIDGYNIITNSPNVSAIDIDWDSEYLPQLSVNFTEQYTGQFQIQIPKNMPRTMNLDFETSLMMDVFSLSNEDNEKDWNEHITEKDFKMIDDRVSETDTLCYYIITVELSEVDYFNIGTYSVASGRWEPVIIENDSCDDLYDGLTMESEPVPEPKQDYSNIEEGSECGFGTTYQDGICVVDKIENSTKISTDLSKRWGSPYTYDVESPLKQIKSGITIDEIKCKESLTLVTKHDGSPACVTPETKIKLIERGWITKYENNSGLTVNFSFCGADGSDFKGNPNTDNSTHHWDENECRWEETWDGYSHPFGSYDKTDNLDPLYTENPNNPSELILDIDAMLLVGNILDDCDSQKYRGFVYDLSYYNETHYIDNNICEWHEFTKYPNTDVYCIPGINKWTGLEPRNDTHIYNLDTCLWEELPIVMDLVE